MTAATTPSGPATPIRKVLIANRGEIAVRIARTCRAMGLGTVAVYSDVDAGAWHVDACDEAIRLGGAAPADSYLRTDLLLAAAARTGADAVHPGYGFLSEAAAFATAVQEAGLTWVGPPPAAIAAMGDKLAAKRTMADAGVPLVPGIDLGADLAAPDLDLDAVADELGFPVMVKAAAGGGGKGMRVVHDRDDLHDAIAAARREAGGAFGDDRVFLERFVERPRHLEVQILADAHGNVVHLFERECSVQRRHQKVVEETPAPGIDARVRAALGEAAVAAARAIGYVNAGTVEFIGDEATLARLRAGEDVDPRDAFAFLEVNTRLQVEHPVTEQVVRVREAAGDAGDGLGGGGLGDGGPLDLVRLQLLVAGGAPLPFTQEQLVQRGHAIEVRLYAEDPANDYLPAVGTLQAFAPASLPGIRWDAGVRAGDEIPTHYDPMLAKVIASAPTRGEAAALLARELDATSILGATTNRDLLVGVLRDEVFLAGDTTTAFLGERFPDGTVPGVGGVAGSAGEGGGGGGGGLAGVALPAALIGVALAGAVERVSGPAAVVPSLRPGFMNAATFEPGTVLDVDGDAWTVRYRAQRDGSWQVRVVPGDGPEDEGPHPDAETYAVLVHGWEPAQRTAGGALAVPGYLDVEVDGHRQRLAIARTDGEAHVVTAAGRVVVVERPRFPEAAGEEVAGATLAPMPGAVVQVAVTEGERVAKGALLVTVEAMKMEHRVTAPFDGEVVEVRVTAGEQVDADQVLVVVDEGAD